MSMITNIYCCQALGACEPDQNRAASKHLALVKVLSSSLTFLLSPSINIIILWNCHQHPHRQPEVSSTTSSPNGPHCSCQRRCEGKQTCNISPTSQMFGVNIEFWDYLKLWLFDFWPTSENECRNFFGWSARSCTFGELINWIIFSSSGVLQPSAQTENVDHLLLSHGIWPDHFQHKTTNWRRCSAL